MGWGSDDLEPQIVDGTGVGPFVLLIGIFAMTAPPGYVSHGHFKTPGVIGPSDPTAIGCHDGDLGQPAWDSKREYVQIEVILPSRPGKSEVWLVPADEWARATDRFPWEHEGSFVSEPREPSPESPQFSAPCLPEVQQSGFDFTSPYQVCPPPPTDGDNGNFFDPQWVVSEPLELELAEAPGTIVLLPAVMSLPDGNLLF